VIELEEYVKEIVGAIFPNNIAYVDGKDHFFSVSYYKPNLYLIGTLISFYVEFAVTGIFDDDVSRLSEILKVKEWNRANPNYNADNGYDFNNR
jgi:hypothetical protein